MQGENRLILLLNPDKPRDPLQFSSIGGKYIQKKTPKTELTSDANQSL